LEAAQREQVIVTRQGRPAGIVLSAHDDERIRGAARTSSLESVRHMHEEAAANGLTEEVLDESFEICG